MYGPNKINILWIYFLSMPAGIFNVGSPVPRRQNWERSEAVHFNASGRDTRDSNVNANDHLQREPPDGAVSVLHLNHVWTFFALPPAGSENKFLEQKRPSPLHFKSLLYSIRR